MRTDSRQRWASVGFIGGLAAMSACGDDLGLTESTSISGTATTDASMTTTGTPMTTDAPTTGPTTSTTGTSMTGTSTTDTSTSTTDTSTSTTDTSTSTTDSSTTDGSTSTTDTSTTDTSTTDTSTTDGSTSTTDSSTTDGSTTDTSTTGTTTDTSTTGTTAETTDSSSTGQAAVCGDGAIDDAEECDDGNDVDTDACLSTCKNASCGDLVVQAGVEQCDDGNNVNADTCSLLCHNAPKAVSLGAGEATAAHGGNGGNPFDLACPPGQALIGFDGRSAGYVDQLTGICGTLAVDVAADKFVVKVAAAGNLTSVGGNGGGPFNSQCPADQVIVGFSGRSGGYVDAIQFSCAPLVISEDGAGFAIATGPVTDLTMHGGNGGAAFPQTNCPAGQIANRKHGRSGGYVDRFGLGCASVGLTF